MSLLNDMQAEEADPSRRRPAETKSCKKCGQSFVVDMGWMNGSVTVCDSCQKVLESERETQLKEREVKAVRERFERFCPPLYRETERLKLPNPIKLDEVLEWKYGSKGLILHGPTGTGKSRCAWVLLVREWKAGASIRILDSTTGIRYAALFADGANKVEEWLDDLISSNIVMFDDVFKNKLTDSFEGVMFTLVDQRIQNRKPIIITSNDTGESLKERMSNDRGEPILRRLREHCTTVQF